MERVIKIQQDLKCPKNQRNNFGNYNFRNCEDILEAVKPLLKENNLCLILTDDLVNVGTRFYVKATATIYDNEGKTIVSNSAFAREEETKKGCDGSQITGASSSYARKYALNGLFAIDDTKDSDTTNTGTDEVKITLTCEECGQEIKDVTTKDGKVYKAVDIFNINKRKYGKGLCSSCSYKLK